MVYGIYTLKDELIAFGMPFADVNDIQAKRNFIFAMQQDNVVGKNRRDYSLFKLGIFDDSTGEVVLESTPTLILRGDDVNEQI